MKTQNEKLLKYMKTHKGITALDAFTKLGIMRLSARIWDLRHEYGCVIVSDFKNVKNADGELVRVARYTLTEVNES